MWKISRYVYVLVCESFIDLLVLVDGYYIIFYVVLLFILCCSTLNAYHVHSCSFSTNRLTHWQEKRQL